MQTKPYADANKDMYSLCKKVYKKDIDKYQKAKYEIQKILKIIMGRNFNKETFKKLNNNLDVLYKEI